MIPSPSCGTRNHAAIPAEVKAHSAGPGIRAFPQAEGDSVYLLDRFTAGG